MEYCLSTMLFAKRDYREYSFVIYNNVNKEKHKHKILYNGPKSRLNNAR